MSRNGSGTYSLPVNSWNPANNGTPATAADYQALINDVAAAITQSLSKDGQTALTGNLPAGGNKITGLAAGTTAGDSVRYEQLDPSALGVPVYAMLQSYLAGCTMSTAGASTTMSISAGVAMDSTNAYLMQLSAIAKTTSSWAVGSGNGGLDTGAIANSTWYHFFVIRRPDTGVVDVLLSLSATSPTLPANYTQFRRIGTGRTNGSAQWTSFIQDGDYFRFLASVLDIGVLNPGTAAVTATLTVPTGVNVEAFVNALLIDTTNIGSGAYLSDLASTDEAPSNSAAPLFSVPQNAVTNVATAANLRVRTNTSAQIRYRLNNSFATLAFRISTLGWYDTRGRNA